MRIQLKNILNEVITEVGEGSSQPFKYTKKNEDNYIIYGETSKGDKITISLNIVVGGDWLVEVSTENDPKLAQELEGQNGIYISFKIDSINGEKTERSYGEVNDIRYMYRLMSTLRQILLPVVQSEDVGFFSYSPTLKFSDYISDKGGGRDILYKLFIKKEFPNAELRGKSDKRIVILNR